MWPLVVRDCSLIKVYYMFIVNKSFQNLILSIVLSAKHNLFAFMKDN
jgi:hypothetical protein